MKHSTNIIPLLFLMGAVALVGLAPSLPGRVAVTVWNDQPPGEEPMIEIPATIVQSATAMLPMRVQGAARKMTTARLQIPGIGVDADVQSMGLTSDGAMAVPGNTTDVGWYDLGTRPGDIGSAVIGGHYRWNAAVGVFHRLDELRVGDSVSVVSVEGVESTFIVRELRTYAADAVVADIFTSSHGVHLNLITCSGAWNPTTKDYADRLVVFTDVE